MAIPIENSYDASSAPGATYNATGGTMVGAQNFTLAQIQAAMQSEAARGVTPEQMIQAASSGYGISEADIRSIGAAMGLSGYAPATTTPAPTQAPTVAPTASTEPIAATKQPQRWNPATNSYEDAPQGTPTNRWDAASGTFVPISAAPAQQSAPTGALTQAAAPTGHYETTQTAPGEYEHTFVPDAVTNTSFNPTALGLTPQIQGAEAPSEQNSGQGSAGIQTGWAKDLGNGTTQQYGVNGEDLGITQNKNQMDYVKQLGAMAANAFLPGVLNGALGAGGALGTNLSGAALSGATGALTGGVTAGLTGGNVLTGALMGGAGGALSNAVGDYLNPSTTAGGAMTADELAAFEHSGLGSIPADTGSLTAGITPASVGAFESALPTSRSIDYSTTGNPMTAADMPGIQLTAPENVPVNVEAPAGALTRTQLDGTTDTAGAAANALDVGKFNTALNAGMTPTEAVNYATDPNQVVMNTNPTDTRLDNNTQLPAGTNSTANVFDPVTITSGRLPPDTTGVSGGLTSLETPRDVRSYDGGDFIGGTGADTSEVSTGTPSVSTQPTLVGKVTNNFTKADGSVDWTKVLVAAGIGASAVGKVVQPTPGTPKSINDLWVSLGKTPTGTTNPVLPGGGGYTPGALTAGAGNRIYSADMLSPIRPGESWKNIQTPWGMTPVPYTSANPTRMYAEGGEVKGALSTAQPFAGFVQGQGGGQDDLVDAKLSAGEYVWDAETVSMLGDGNNAEGARKLDEARQAIRAHKRSAPDDQIAPQAQGALSYMKGGQ